MWRSGSSLEDGFSGAPRRFITQLYEKAILEKPPCASATFVVHVHVRHPHSAPSRLCSHGALWIRGYTRTRGYTKGIGKCSKMENTLLTRSRESFAMSSKGSAVHACRSTHGCRRLQLWSHGQPNDIGCKQSAFVQVLFNARACSFLVRTEHICSRVTCNVCPVVFRVDSSRCLQQLSCKVDSGE